MDSTESTHFFRGRIFRGNIGSCLETTNCKSDSAKSDSDAAITWGDRCSKRSLMPIRNCFETLNAMRLGKTSTECRPHNSHNSSSKSSRIGITPPKRLSWSSSIIPGFFTRRSARNGAEEQKRMVRSRAPGDSLRSSQSIPFPPSDSLTEVSVVNVASGSGVALIRSSNRDKIEAKKCRHRRFERK